jgi:hypothetical protein
MPYNGVILARVIQNKGFALKHLLLAVIFLFSGWAAAADNVLFLSKYELSADRQAVFGLFDMGNKPSIRIVLPSKPSANKRARFELSGKYFKKPNLAPFSLVAVFQDASGKSIPQTVKIVFDGTQYSSKYPEWFYGMERVAGQYGRQPVEISIPNNASILDLTVVPSSAVKPANALVGYLSRLQY